MARRAARQDRPVEEAVIRDLTMGGQGVADTPGKAAFVDAAITGERVRFRRMRKRRNYDEAELLEVLESSPDRVQPACEYFGTCGGCSLQHVAPAAQLQMKQHSLLQALERIGAVTPERIIEPLAGSAFGYRRRARVGVKYVEKKARVLVGFREKHKPYIADMQHCATLAPELAQLLVPLAELIASLRIARRIPQVEMSLGDASLSLVLRVLEEPDEADREALRTFGAAHAATIWLQTGGPATVQPMEGVPASPLYYELPEFDLRLEFGPLDFIQVNQDMNRRMLGQALELVGDVAGLRVLDLFCGIGNFSLPFARTAAAVTGIELEAAMVTKARANAVLNGIENAEFRAADLAAAEPQDAAVLAAGADLVVLDPPRAGAEAILGAVAATGAPRILYVSCHAGSLARDAGELVRAHGFRLKAAGAMDMFPQTSHVEAMALFER